MKKYLEKMKKVVATLDLGNQNGYTVAIAIALIFVSTLLLGYYFIFGLQPKTYTNMYVLDFQQKKAIDYPEVLVSGKNNTFFVWIGVENHMDERQSCEILQKVTKDPIDRLPVEADAESVYSETIEDGETWETEATITINEIGSYYVIFELWLYDRTIETFKFSNNYSVLSIEVI